METLAPSKLKVTQWVPNCGFGSLNFKHMGLTRLDEDPHKDLRTQHLHFMRAHSRQPSLLQAPEDWSCRGTPCPLCSHHLPVRHFWAVIEQCYLNDAFALSEQVHGLKRVSLAHLHRCTPAATSVSSFYTAKMPLLYQGRLELRLTETRPFQIPTLIHLWEGCPGCLPQGLMTVLPIITLSHLCLQP